MRNRCLFCGGDASEPDHLVHCDGRQGAVEVDVLVLDAAQGEALKREGIARADAGAPEAFKDLALLAVQRVARERDTFVSDDVWMALDGLRTRENRAMGAVLGVARSLGWIVPTAEFRPTAQPLRHRSPVRVWRSLIRGAR